MPIANRHNYGNGRPFLVSSCVKVSKVFSKYSHAHNLIIIIIVIYISITIAVSVLVLLLLLVLLNY